MHETAVAEARFRGMVEVSPDAIVTIDREGQIVLVNGQTETLFGYARAEMLGQPVEMLMPERLQGLHTHHRSSYVEMPRIRPMGANLELLGRRKDGSEFPIEISLGPIEVDGQLLVISTIRDVTERKRNEAALQAAREEAEAANEAKSEFLSRMSHELRTPLNAILGFSQLLQMESLSADQRDSVDHILRAGRHLLELINEVLDISSIEAGRLSLSPEPVAIEELLREAQDLVRPLAMEHSVRLEDSTPLTGLHALADRQRLRQVMLNLLTNAVKYNRRGGAVTLSASVTPAGRLLISIAETGKGIASAQMSRLFTAFDRLGAEQTAVEGTGLGLALSKRLVEAMDGIMGVESIVGEGSTFWVELPLTESAALAGARLGEDALRSLEPAMASTKNILYIEDNIDSFELMERIFSHWPGVKLLPAMQGRIGLELARQHHPDLILLDIHLPDIGGLEVLQRLRADPATRDIPVVVTSADATQSQIDRLLGAGADYYLTKPIDVPHFAEVVRRHLA